MPRIARSGTLRREPSGDRRSARASFPSRPVSVQWIVRKIVQRFKPRRVILFGSRARRNAAPDSDYDLCVEMPSRKTPPERACEVGAIFGLRTWSLDLVVYTPAEMRRLRTLPGSLVRTIEREGKVLYERA